MPLFVDTPFVDTPFGPARDSFVGKTLLLKLLFSCSDQNAQTYT